MKKIGLWLALCLAALSPVSAQISVEVLQDQDQFLQGESIPVAVRVTNRSGQTLNVGGEDNWLTFGIETTAGSLIRNTGDVPVREEFSLPSSKMATKRVDIQPYFALNRPGRYLITASVRIPEWPREIPPSPPKAFEIIEGTHMWEQEFGVPPVAGATNSAPEVRRYILQQANYLKGQLRLYLRITDASGAKTIRVFPIGTLVSVSRPEFQVDQLSRLHALFENGPHSFAYMVFNPDGEMLVRQTYDLKTTRARLKAEADGNIAVVGGSRRITRNDVPASQPSEPADTAEPLNPGTP
jgi:hypothetical protein